jgi:hypothetical protein
MKHFMCTHTFHSEETKKQFFAFHKGKKSADWFKPINNEDSVQCLSTWIGDQDFWFCHWFAESEDLIHKKLETLKGDKLFYTMAQEMNSFITSSKPKEDFI